MYKYLLIKYLLIATLCTTIIFYTGFMVYWINLSVISKIIHSVIWGSIVGIYLIDRLFRRHNLWVLYSNLQKSRFKYLFSCTMISIPFLVLYLILLVNIFGI